MKRHQFTAAQTRVLAAEYANTDTAALAQRLGLSTAVVYRKARAMGLRKTPEFLAQAARERVTAPGHASAPHRFKPGQKPWNTGISHKAGGKAPLTQFKPGHRPHTWVPVGSYRIVTSKNGGPEVQRKISDADGPQSARWRAVARLTWEAAHGPVPEGHVVVFRPGCRTTDPQRITIDTVELVHRADLMRRNSYQNLPPELAAVTHLRGVLKRAINEAGRKGGATPTTSTTEP